MLGFCAKNGWYIEEQKKSDGDRSISYALIILFLKQYPDACIGDKGHAYSA